MTEQHRLFFVVFVLSCGLAYALTADEYISLGDEDFIARKLDKALSNYDKAISADSSSERAYYKRATIYIQTKKYRQALYDLNQVLIINPNYHLALISRAQVHQEQGDFEKAKEDLSSVLKINPKSSTKVDQQLGVIADIETKLEEGTKHFANKDYTSAREKFGTIIDKAPGLSKVRLLRSEAAYKLRLWNEVIEDTGKILKQEAKNLKAILIRGNAFRQLGQLDAAVNHYKNCLGWAEDADCKRSLALLEQFRSDLASANDNDEEGRALLTLRDVEKCIQYIEAEDVDYFKVEVYTLRCSAYVEYKEADKALEACNVVLSIDEKNGDAFQLKGEAYILKEDFEEGVRMYQKAVEAGDNSAQEGLGNAKRLLKISKRKDYYKILGVEKTANAKDVKKAYRLLALKWHPDKNPDNPEAQKIFLDLMEANEVLSSDDMRRRYDNGEDIEDLQKPQSPFQSNNPFQGGFTFHWG